jgi:Zn finger protein HypA/HybF involved in hydrogenase expression
MESLFAEEPNVIMCINCDAEFTIQEVSADNGEVCFCPFCGNELHYDDDEDFYDENEDA